MGLVRRLRFTLLIGTVVVGLQVLSRDAARHRRLVRAMGLNWPNLAAGRVWRLATGLLVEDQVGLRWSILVPFLWVGVAEWFLGWRRTALTFFATDWVSSVIVLVGLRIHAPHSAWSARELIRLDTGTSAAIYGTLAALCASRRGDQRWLSTLVLTQGMFTIWLTNRRLFDVQHLLAIAVGIALGVWFGRRPRTEPGTSSPHLAAVRGLAWHRGDATRNV